MESVVNPTILPYYSGKKVFVTGHTGFKGTWFTGLLQMAGARIKGYALAPESAPSLFTAMAPGLKLENVIADIRDNKKLQEAIHTFQPDFVFHLAAQALVRRSYEIPAETFDVNVTGTANLLEAVNMLDRKCTVVVITTDKVYENKEAHHYYNENDRLGGYDPYSASKAATEIVVSSFRNSFFPLSAFSSHQKAIASARAGNVIGGGDWNKDRIIPDIIRALKANEPVDVRNPNAVRPWQHVLEPLNGYLLLGMLLDMDPVKYSGAYNFGPLPEDHLAVKDLVEIAISCWGESALPGAQASWVNRSDATAVHEAGLLKLDISKARQVLNWQPALSSKKAIELTIDWYKQNAGNVFEYTMQQIKNFGQL